MSDQIWEQRVGRDDEISCRWHHECRLTSSAGSKNFPCSALGRNGSQWQFARHFEPFVFGGVIALERRMDLRTSTHHPGRDRGDKDLVARKFGANCIGET